MPQRNVWEKEYRQGALVTGHDEPQATVRRWVKWLKKEQGIDLSVVSILDVGCGTGRNANYLAEFGANVTGMDIAPTALRAAQARASDLPNPPKYLEASIGSTYPFEENQFDLALDVTASNSLSATEREVYLEELHRTLKPGGFLFVRALCKDGDKHAKHLIKTAPGPDPDTYIHPVLGLVERVFSAQDFHQTYESFFKVHYLKKEQGYTACQGQSYKRNFWVAYLENRPASLFDKPLQHDTLEVGKNREKGT